MSKYISKYLKAEILLKMLTVVAILFASCNRKTEQPYDDHFVRGNNYFVNLDCDNALKEYIFSIKEDPNNANAYYGMGQAYFLKGDYEKAIEYYESFGNQS